MVLGVAAIASTTPTTVAAEAGANGSKADYHGRFAELPVGAVQPRGWIQKWLERQAQGLTGHPENLTYPFDTCLFAGNIPKPANASKSWKEWWPYEQAGYFVDATTRLSWLVNDASLNQRRDANLDYILNHSAGTNYGSSRACWPNAVVGRALMAQLDATDNPRVQAVMQDWLLTSKDEILKGGRAGANFEEAFYLYGRTGDKRLLELCRAIYENYLSATNSFCGRKKILSDAPFHEHGVTVAETLKCLPMMYLYTGDPEALQLAGRAYQKVVSNNLMADGGMVSAEYLESTKFDSLHESCDITDWSWSLGYLLMATGEGKWADLIERTTFNALPGAVSKDFKQLQYFSGVNQMLVSSEMSNVPHCRTRLTYRAAHDTECCAGNINRAMPNYVTRMWMRSQDSGLAALFYGPSEVATTVEGQPVIIREETDYPFRDEVSFVVKTPKPVRFGLHLRIPEWCADASIQVNGAAANQSCPSGTFVALNREFRDGDRVVLKLPMAVKLEEWLDGRSMVVARGPLVYSLKMDERRVELTSDTAGTKAVLHGHDIREFPALEFFPASEWRYGLDARQKSRLDQIEVIESPMSDNPFVAETSPILLNVPMHKLPRWAESWKPGSTGNSSAKGFIARSPSGFPNEADRKVEGKATPMLMVPYGATHLRLTTLPVVSAPADGKTVAERADAVN